MTGKSVIIVTISSESFMKYQYKLCKATPGPDIVHPGKSTIPRTTSSFITIKHECTMHFSLVNMKEQAP
jgi:hypothetical protein